MEYAITKEFADSSCEVCTFCDEGYHVKSFNNRVEMFIFLAKFEYIPVSDTFFYKKA